VIGSDRIATRGTAEEIGLDRQKVSWNLLAVGFGLTVYWLIGASMAYAQIKQVPVPPPDLPIFPHPPEGHGPEGEGASLLAVVGIIAGIGLVFVVGCLCFLGLAAVVAAFELILRPLALAFTALRFHRHQRQELEKLVVIYAKGTLTKKFGGKYNPNVDRLVDDLRKRGKIRSPASVKPNEFRPELITSEDGLPDRRGNATVVVRYDRDEVLRFVPRKYGL
jgi:hypothetical protein